MQSTRPSVLGKFLFAGPEKLYVKGVTYGTFAPAGGGHQYPEPDVVSRDFQVMATQGINCIRTYTCPPRWLLDEAAEAGLRVMVGLDWEDHTAFLGDKAHEAAVLGRVQQAVRTCAGHPAILAYAVGNEIPGQVVRWHGAGKTEAFLMKLLRAAREADPGSLFTYVNYPPTEYLHVSDVDFVSFNVYLEREGDLKAYLARLQNLAGDKPLLITELGLDSRRHTEAHQARVLDWQVRATFAGGCAGAFVFAWTDQWYRGGHEIEDWDFGLTTREREPKPALASVESAFADVPFSPALDWPRISIVVCSCNGSRTIVDTLEAISKLDYPCYETIVVNDGSTDATAEIASRYPVHLISTENRGLSSARNTGAEAASGEIVAYIDDDAYPDPHWLRYLAWSFMTTDHVGIGGPNLPPAGDGFAAECVANTPGGPMHVLLTDELAEHIPGCNMAFRKHALDAIGGFDVRYRTAGDDVDVCWRLLDAGGTLGFNHAALVWHHRRNSLRAFWRQQAGYGRAEALLEAKWPERYNASGHLSWSGRLYGDGVMRPLGLGQRIYHGPSGSAPFQSMYATSPAGIWSLPQMPEWYLLILSLLALAAIGVFWTPLLAAGLASLSIAVLLLLLQTWKSVSQATFPRSNQSSTSRRLSLRAVTFYLHLIQPLARLRGRIRHGLTLWRRHGSFGFAWPLPHGVAYWTGEWASPSEHQTKLHGRLLRRGAVVLPGGAFDRWDTEIRGGLLASYRLLQAVEEHGSGIQRVLYQGWPRISRLAGVLLIALGVPATAAVIDGATMAAILLLALCSFTLAVTLTDAIAAAFLAREAIAGVSATPHSGEKNA